MGNVTRLGIEKRFPVNLELLNRLESVIYDYDGEISLCEALGVIELLKHGLIEAQKKSEETK
ncbi:hypothetical protein R9X49_06580 [Pectobacterium carotovorum]|uniref:hypothetical protein n=1 Tax=Pectobacterium carotovorum TaxID=554 RepID=UPI0029DC8E80|nr:hypothetical protein [Pectobacterium carotovorum]MDX6914772.1 hypothetical protein [Pectobacterium carotovorum]